MTTDNFSTTIFVDQSAEDVFNAINRVNEWWQGEVEGNTSKLDDEFTYRMEEVHYSKQKIVESICCKKIVWLVIESSLNNFKNKTEWNGTKIIFDISSTEKQTQLCFTHSGLNPCIGCYGDCSYAWEQLLQKSLFSLITTGKGKKVF